MFVGQTSHYGGAFEEARAQFDHEIGEIVRNHIHPAHDAQPKMLYAFLREERLRILAHKLDDKTTLASPKTMLEALRVYNSNRDEYLKKVHDLIVQYAEHEKLIADWKRMLLDALKAYEAKVKAITATYLKAIEAKGKNGPQGEHQGEGSEDQLGQKLLASMQDSDTHMIAAVTAEFEARRQKHLAAASGVESECTQLHRQVLDLHGGIEAQYQQALHASRQAIPRDEHRLMTVGQVLVRLRGIAEECRSIYSKGLSHPFLDERHRDGIFIAGEMGYHHIRDIDQRTLNKFTKDRRPIFIEARKLAEAAKPMMEECAQLAEHATLLFDQMKRLAGGQPAEEALTEEAKNSCMQVTNLLNKSIQEAERLKFDGLRKYLNGFENRPTNWAVERAEREFRDCALRERQALQACEEACVSADRLARRARSRLPADFLNNQGAGLFDEVFKLNNHLRSLNEENRRQLESLLEHAQALGLETD